MSDGKGIIPVRILSVDELMRDLGLKEKSSAEETQWDLAEALRANMEVAREATEYALSGDLME